MKLLNRVSDHVEPGSPGIEPAGLDLALSGLRYTTERAVPFVPGRSGGRISVGAASMDVPHSSVVSLSFLVRGTMAAAGQDVIRQARRRLEAVKRQFLQESDAMVSLQRLETQLATMKAELAVAERKPEEIATKIRRLLVAGQSVDQAEAEHEQAVAKIGKLRDRLKILEPVARQSRLSARENLFRVLDAERAAIELEVIQEARQLADQIAAASARHIEALRTADAVAAFLRSVPVITSAEGGSESVAAQMAEV